MKASELRIGNFVRGNLGNNEIESIDSLDLFVINCENEDEFAPIPLTEEWLVRFGFKEGTTDSLKAVTHASLSRMGNDYMLYQGHYCLYVKIKHVHQLQNLYFALTGEELTIK